jgi:hypothetical protein
VSSPFSITIHRGTRVIGGSCVELACGKTGRRRTSLIGKKAAMNEEFKVFMRQHMEDIYQENLRIAAAQDAGVGGVGIFWIHEGFLLRRSTPYTKGEDYGDFVNIHSDHRTIWGIEQWLHPKLMEYEYDQVPRGRVVFSKRDGKFHIYGSEPFVKNEAEKMMVLEGFSIAASEAVFRFDEHYSMAAGDLPDDSCDDFGRSI